jgi:hypothetical protein
MSQVYAFNLSPSEVERGLDQFEMATPTPQLTVIDLFLAEHGRALALELSQGLYDRRWVERYRFFAESVVSRRPSF